MRQSSGTTTTRLGDGSETRPLPFSVTQIDMSLKTHYLVTAITAFECKDWLLGKHYAKRIPSISWAFGLFHESNLIGICTFGTPASSTLLRGVCGEMYATAVCELNRLVINDGQQKNVASYFVSTCLAALPKPKIVVSYADTAQGHHGYIYQATNFVYTGLSIGFRDPQVRGLEHQHHATYAHGKTDAELQQEFGERLYYKERSRKHRYIYFTGTKNEKKQMRLALRYPIVPYPKGDNQRYDASYSPVVQGRLFI